VTPAPDERPSEAALKIAESVPHNWRCDPSYRGTLPCGYLCDRYVTALEVDRLIRTRVAEMKERCAFMLESKFLSGRTWDGYRDKWTREAVAAIRALPEEGK
jgi:hypothetical protein